MGGGDVLGKYFAINWWCFESSWWTIDIIRAVINTTIVIIWLNKLKQWNVLGVSGITNVRFWLKESCWPEVVDPAIVIQIGFLPDWFWLIIFIKPTAWLVVIIISIIAIFNAIVKIWDAIKITVIIMGIILARITKKIAVNDAHSITVVNIRIILALSCIIIWYKILIIKVS